MRLKSLELHGFKSFPDRTKLSFESGVTVIVGPNGSGKSNISDAIRWVLGELSTKNIRGNKMEDVIFGGTDSRSSMGFAEVSLTIQNDGENRIDMDYDEITVTRRYYRSGDSEYLINNKVVRLRDIVEIFMNTGIGKTGYSIIGQGKISEIISQKGEERRIIFEEAAGISKYRYKKQDAEKRLAEADGNLERVSDILAELSARVGPLEKDAAKAKIYLDLFEKKKSVDVSIAVYDLSQIGSRREIAENDYVVAEHELEMLDDTLTSLEKREESLFEQKQQAQRSFEEAQSEENQLSVRYNELNTRLMVTRNDLAHQERTLVQLGERQTLIASSKEAKTGELEALRTQLQAHQTLLDEGKKDYEAIEQALNDARSASVSAEQAYENLIAEKNTQNDAYTAARIEWSALSSSRSSDSTRRQEYAEQIAQKQESIKALNETLANHRTRLSEYETKKAEEEEKGKTVRLTLTSLRSESEQLQNEITATGSKIASLEQRASALRRMEEHFEGYNRSVKFVAEASRRGRLSGICGPVSQLISVDRQYALAIETALGAAIQNLVVENEDAAKAAIALLKRENAGRATFYPLTSVKSSTFAGNPAELKKTAGYVGIASELVGFDDRYKNVISNLLGRTAIFDTLDHATLCAKQNSYRFRIVTLDGQVINAGGSFTGGSAGRDSGILTRAAEIESLDKERASLTEKRTALSQELKTSIDAIHSAEKDVEEYDAQISLLSVLCNSEQASLKLQANRLHEEEDALSALLASLEDLSRADSKQEAEVIALQKKCEALEEQLKSLDEAIRSAAVTRSQASDLLTQRISEKNNAIVQLSIREKELEALNARFADNEASLQSLEEEAAANLTSQLALQGELRRLSAQITEDERAVESLSKDIGLRQNQSKQFTEEAMALEMQINKVRQTSREKSAQRERVFMNYTTLKANLDKISAEKDKLTERLWEDYELTYAAACECNHEPITEETRSSAISQQSKLRSKIRELGSVNVGAIEEYKQVKERYELLTAQVEDLNKSRKDFTDIISKLEREMCQRFSDTFEQVNRHFKDVFVQLFGGGSANLSLTDPENVLTSGIDIEVAPPGKIIKNLKLLSGGEQVFVAIAIFFAILKVNPSPFCLLDEIESALDEVNVDRFAAYARMFSDNTQFIIITHRRGSMEAADTLYGVTMQEKGISKVLSMNVNEVEQKLGVKL